MKENFMKLKHSLNAICFLFLGVSSLKAQVHFDWNLNSSLYVWENIEENQNLDFYQGVQLRVFHEKYSNLQFKSYFRFAHNGDPAEWNEKVYNSYLDWKSPDKKYGFRFGRQFLYHGVMNGSVDGLLISTKATKNLAIKVLAGVPVPINRNVKVMNWLDGNIIGGYTSFRISNDYKANLSYFQKTKNEETVWQQMGAILSGKIINDFYFMTRVDYNLKSSEYQNMRYRITYFNNKFTVSGEFNSQKPRVYEDSFFRFFEIEAYNQIRSSVAYQLGEYRIRLRNFYTIYEDENSNQLHLSVANNWALVGFIFQNGYAGDNTGFFGEINYDLLNNMSVKLYSSYNNFQRHSVEIDEEALSFSGRIKYKVIKDLDLQLEVQESQNSYFSNDLRGLFRLNYRFTHTL
jgi:hypothetical protein